MKTNTLFIILQKLVFRYSLWFMTESASGSFLFESQDGAGYSTKRSGDDEEEKSE